MYRCKICNKNFKKPQSLAAHCKSHSKTSKQLIFEESPILCKECNTPVKYVTYTHKHSVEFCSYKCRAKYKYKLLSTL